MILLPLIAFLISLVIVALTIPAIVRNSESSGILDTPNKRKVHTTPVSRLGGLCFVPTMFVSLALILLFDEYLGLSISVGTDGLTNSWSFLVLLLSSLILYVTGIFDDLYGLDYKFKFVAQIMAASFIGFGLISPFYGINPMLAFAILFIVYVVNSINLIDGIDGLASGLSMIALLALTACHIELNSWFGATIGASMIGVLLAFFYYNVASLDYKIFMGDTGSTTLGLILSYLIISLFMLEEQESKTSFPLTTICISTLAIPLLDVIRVMVIRIHNGKSPFLADKNHIHHLLMQHGCSSSLVLKILLWASIAISLITWIIVSLVSLY